MTEQYRNITKTLVFIPTFNDRELLNELTNEILSLDENYDVFVIDDGSTPEIKPMNLIERYYFYRAPFNVGLGLITNIAINFALFKKYDVLIRVDGDGQHNISSLPLLENEIRKNNADFVISNRVNQHLENSLRNSIGNLIKLILTRLCNYFSNLEVEDWHSGMMAFSKEAMTTLKSHTLDKYPETEIIFFLKYKKLKIATVDVTQQKRLFSSSTVTLFQALRHVSKVLLLILYYKFKG